MNSQAVSKLTSRFYPPNRKHSDENAIYLLKGAKVKKLPDYTKIIFSSAEEVFKNLKESNKPSQNDVIVNTLRELLTCQMRYLIGIYLGIFLQADYKDKNMDQRVYNYLKGINNSYNELLGLGEETCRFLKKEKLDQIYDNRLFNIRFDRMRLKAPPISDLFSSIASSLYVNYGNHVMGVMKAFGAEVAFLENSWIEIEWNQTCYDNLKGFQKAAGKLIKRDVTKSSQSRGLMQESGSCTLNLEAGEIKTIPLDPMIIPLYNRSRKTRLASLGKFGGYMAENICPITYRELIGDGLDFNTNNAKLLNHIYYKKGLVAEDPTFSHKFYMSQQDTIIQLYEGDIFDLNFLEGIKENKVSAMVNILYNDLNNKTRLFQSLESLAGSEVSMELAKQADGRIILRNDRVYTTGSGDLNFNFIIHCPIYDTKEQRNRGLDVIKTAITNILEVCQKKNVDWLIVPAMGSFYAGQIRNDVASAWCEEIKNMARQKNSSIKRIIFSFINEETCEVYRNCISEKNENRFSACHLPVSRMHSYLETSVNQKNRLDYALNLSDYLYGFIVAMSIRAIMWQKIDSEKTGKTFEMRPGAQKFVKEICKRAGMDFKNQIKPEFLKSLNIGDWRSLANMGYQAIKDSKWSFDSWYHESDRKKLDSFSSFLTNGKNSIDFPNIRNRMAHSTWHDIPQSELSIFADKAVKGIKTAIENMPFLEQKKNQMIMVEAFSVNEDEGICQLTYRDLGGHFNIPPQKIDTFKTQNLDGRFFENGKVYLLERIPDGLIKSLNMHPFLVYGPCPGCGKKKLFVWRDLLAGDNNDVKIIYGSMTCHCNNINDDKIAGFSHAKLEERFVKVLTILQTDKIHPLHSENL